MEIIVNGNAYYSSVRRAEIQRCFDGGDTLIPSLIMKTDGGRRVPSGDKPADAALYQARNGEVIRWLTEAAHNRR